jgi:hypothetical protein
MRTCIYVSWVILLVLYFAMIGMSFGVLTVSETNKMGLPASDCERFTVMNAACTVASVARSPDGASCSSYVNCSDFSSRLRVPCPLPSGSHPYPSAACPVVGAVVAIWFRNGALSLTEPADQGSVLTLVKARFDIIYGLSAATLGAVFATSLAFVPSLTGTIMYLTFLNRRTIDADGAVN